MKSEEGSWSTQGDKIVFCLQRPSHLHLGSEGCWALGAGVGKPNEVFWQRGLGGGDFARVSRLQIVLFHLGCSVNKQVNGRQSCLEPAAVTVELGVGRWEGSESNTGFQKPPEQRKMMKGTYALNRWRLGSSEQGILMRRLELVTLKAKRKFCEEGNNEWRGMRGMGNAYLSQVKTARFISSI